MNNLDLLLIEEAKRAIVELDSLNRPLYSTTILEKITGIPYEPCFSTNNIGFTTFLTTYQKELGIEFISLVDIRYNSFQTITGQWRVSSLRN